MKYLPFIFFILLFSFIISCKNESNQATVQGSENNMESALTGKKLAKAYCASCHVFAEPGSLDKKTWKFGVLPQMGYRMGIYGKTPRESLIESGVGGKLVERQNIYPLTPSLNEEQWKQIGEYYYENAPDKLTLPKKEIQMGIPGLKVRVPEFHISPPMVTAIKYNQELNEIYIADAKADYSTINVLDGNFKSVSTLALPSPISHISYKSDTIMATLMGGFMPTDNPGGSIIKIFKKPNENVYSGFTSILKNLQRPVYSTYTDMNGDGQKDIIVCEFGNHTGALSLYINLKNGKYQKKILSQDPGSSRVVVKDMNQDGLPDIVALMAQGNERIDVYYNKGNDSFEVSNLLKFPASYGSVSFSMVDWNSDGYEDIIYINGDNADYSMTLKPYHGLRIYLNDGENNFSEAFFQHQNGAYKSINHDFDNDGDQDIALASFFPDLVNNPEEGFIYMENISIEDSIQFKLNSFKQVSSGRWLIMETIDLNKNRTPELLLGSFTGMGINGDTDGKIAKHFVENSPTLMLLTFD